MARSGPRKCPGATRGAHWYQDGRPGDALTYGCARPPAGSASGADGTGGGRSPEPGRTVLGDAAHLPVRRRARGGPPQGRKRRAAVTMTAGAVNAPRAASRTGTSGLTERSSSAQLPRRSANSPACAARPGPNAPPRPAGSGALSGPPSTRSRSGVAAGSPEEHRRICRRDREAGKTVRRPSGRRESRHRAAALSNPARLLRLPVTHAGTGRKALPCIRPPVP